MSSPAASTPARFAPWMAISLVAALLACAWLTLRIVRVVELRRENATLRQAAAQLERLREEHDELQRRRTSVRQSENAARDREEITALRAEAEQLRAAAAELPALRDEARRLQAERAAAAARAGVAEEPDPLAEAKGKAERINCVNNLKQVGLAARMWANDHGEVFPTGFLSMSNELSTPKILTCSGDKTRQRAQSWAQFDGSSVSYEWLVPPGLREGDPQIAITRCPLHNNVGLSDGSVQQLPPNQRVELVDGKYRVVRVNPVPASTPP